MNIADLIKAAEAVSVKTAVKHRMGDPADAEKSKFYRFKTKTPTRAPAKKRTHPSGMLLRPDGTMYDPKDRPPPKPITREQARDIAEKPEFEERSRRERAKAVSDWQAAESAKYNIRKAPGGKTTAPDNMTDDELYAVSTGNFSDLRGDPERIAQLKAYRSVGTPGATGNAAQSAARRQEIANRQKQYREKLTRPVTAEGRVLPTPYGAEKNIAQYDYTPEESRKKHVQQYTSGASGKDELLAEARLREAQQRQQAGGKIFPGVAEQTGKDIAEQTEKLKTMRMTPEERVAEQKNRQSTPVRRTASGKYVYNWYPGMTPEQMRGDSPAQIAEGQEKSRARQEAQTASKERRYQKYLADQRRRQQAAPSGTAGGAGKFRKPPASSGHVKDLIKKALDLPPKDSPVWDSVAGAFPEMGGPLLGGIRTGRGESKIRNIMKGAVGGVGGGTMGAMAGAGLSGVAALVMARLGVKYPALLDYLKYLGAGAGGAAGIRLTTTKKGQAAEAVAEAARTVLGNPVVASMVQPLVTEKARAALQLMAGLGMLDTGRALPFVRLPRGRHGLLT